MNMDATKNDGTLDSSSLRRLMFNLDQSHQAEILDFPSSSDQKPINEPSFDSLSVHQKGKHLLVNGLKITPSCLIFKDAYDGKCYTETITITNCSKTSVNVRIFPPTSKAFKIKTMPVGRSLSPGLSIIRKVKYSYISPTAVHQACMDIFADNQCIRYEFLVFTCFSNVTVSPKHLDYGELDMGIVSEVKTVILTNTGTKQAPFAVALGRNKLELVIEPLKGILQPGQSREMTVEVFGTCEGEFNQEFWIKTEPLQWVHVQGRFINPTLKIDYPLSSCSLVILTFPSTFFGIKQQRSLVIRNRSSSSAVFCVKSRAEDKLLPYKETMVLDENLKQFDVRPLEGRLHKKQRYVMNITYFPQKQHTASNYYIACIEIDFRHWRPEGNPCINTKSHSVDSYNISRVGSASDTISVSTIRDSGEEIQEVALQRDHVAILVYAEVENLSISVEPDSFSLKQLQVYDTHSEILRFFNHSKTLPLTMKFVKAANLDLEPKILHLPPSELVMATLKVRPTKMGNGLTKVVLDVFYQSHKLRTIKINVLYNAEYTQERKLSRLRKPNFLPGITPTNCHEVGYLVDNVRFNTRIQKPVMAIVDKLTFDKANNALIAFPNDRQRTLRPWRNETPCKTIFAQLPRLVTNFDVEYDLSDEEILLKQQKDAYYLNYIRNLPGKKRNKDNNNEIEKFEDYPITDQKKVLMEQLAFYKNKPACPPIPMDVSNRRSTFVPLTPYELHNVIITPKFVQLGRLAANTLCSDSFLIENQNSFPIHISIKSLYSSIDLPRHSFILGDHDQKNIEFIYHSENAGSYHLPMFIIVNFFHQFEVTVLATIVTNTVKCTVSDVTINPAERTVFLELRNPINSSVKFELDTADVQLEAFPVKGVIPARRNMTFTLTLDAKQSNTQFKEIAVISESGSRELLEVHIERKKASMVISSDTVIFQDVPLNTEMSRELVISNTSDLMVPMDIEIENNELIPELTINPTQGLILQKGYLIVQLTVKFKEVVEFKATVTMTFQHEFTRKIEVTGNVVYPQISLRPEMIKIPKIPSGSVATTSFKMANKSEVTNYLIFPMDDYPEFSVKTRHGEDITGKILTLAGKEKRDFLLEFHPQEPLAYCIYLPYILNGFLGPPELNSPETLKTKFYVGSVMNTCKTTRESLNQKLKVLKILCAAGKPWLAFNSLQLDFHSHKNESQTFEISNCGDVSQQCTLNLSQVKTFTLTPISDNVVFENNLMNVTLNTEETCTICIEYTPDCFGQCIEDVPIIVERFSDTNPFNILKLKGENVPPTIVTSSSSIYFTPTCAGSRETKKLQVTLKMHFCDKALETLLSDCEGIKLELIDQDAISEFETLFHYVATFEPLTDCFIESEVTFRCPCQTSARTKIFARSDNALLIKFLSSPSLIQSSTYPLFPMESDESSYAQLMRTITGVVEKWLYSQGYFYQNYYQIPEDIARCPFGVGAKDKGVTNKKAVGAQLPLVQLLINLIDNTILKYMENDLAPSQDPKERALYNFVTYRNAISFMKSQGIKVPGLKPEHLLVYSDYEQFKDNFEEEDPEYPTERLSYEEFYRFSKQKWLDLFFNIYKILVQERTVNPQWQGNKKCHTNLVRDEDFEQYFQNEKDRFSNWSPWDVKLLLWLEYHCNRQRNILFTEEKFDAVHRLNDLSDIDDSVSLALATIAYCPYVIDQLNDIYALPKSLEQKAHNACKVVQAWKSLGLSFDIHPKTIVTGNPVKFVFIVTYLYEVLPHFLPSNEITIEAQLSESATYDLSVQNCGHVSIQYRALFFGADSDLFKLDATTATIPAGRSKTFKLTYFAKRMLNASMILVFTGEGAGQRYAKSLATSVTGIPQTTSCNEIKMPVETYEVCKRKINLKTPYGQSYVAKLYICFDVPKSYRDLHAVAAMKQENIPGEIDFSSTECEFLDKGEAIITFTTCFLTQGLRPYYLYFCNPGVGDFCVLINFISTISKLKAIELGVELPHDFHTEECLCKRGFNPKCRRNIQVYIPAKNQSLWEASETLLRTHLEAEGTLKLFERFFQTQAGFRLLRYCLERLPMGRIVPACIFNDRGEFIVQPSKNFKPAIPNIVIEDVTTEDWVPLVLHWEQQAEPKETLLDLRNNNGKEMRLYKLVFIRNDDQSNENNQSIPSTTSSH